jgi:hypothetical protein
MHTAGTGMGIIMGALIVGGLIAAGVVVWRALRVDDPSKPRPRTHEDSTTAPPHDAALERDATSHLRGGH